MNNSIYKIDKRLNPKGRSINNTYTIQNLIQESESCMFTNWTDDKNFPEKYGSGIYIVSLDAKMKFIIYMANKSLFYTYVGYDGIGKWYKVSAS